LAQLQSHYDHLGFLHGDLFKARASNTHVLQEKKNFNYLRSGKEDRRVIGADDLKWMSEGWMWSERQTGGTRLPPAYVSLVPTGIQDYKYFNFEAGLDWTGQRDYR